MGKKAMLAKGDNAFKLTGQVDGNQLVWSWRSFTLPVESLPKVGETGYTSVLNSDNQVWAIEFADKSNEPSQEQVDWQKRMGEEFVNGTL
jgi:hypothetical protein